MDDVSRELRAFLDYVAGKKSEDAFVGQLEEALREAKRNREWRHEYMTLLMRDRENLEKGIELGREEGREEGREKERKETIEKMKRKGFTIDQIKFVYDITEEEIKKYTEDAE